MPTCQWELWGDDMYPEFAPEPILYESCERPATHLVVTDDWPTPSCEQHASEHGPESTIEVMDPAFGRGYDLGVSEAALVELTDREVAWLCHEDELPERLHPRDVTSGEWAGESLAELGLTDDATAGQYDRGYTVGWQGALRERAARIHHRQAQEL